MSAYARRTSALNRLVPFLPSEAVDQDDYDLWSLSNLLNDMVGIDSVDERELIEWATQIWEM